MSSKDYAVIGLGKFGQAVVDTLNKLGKTVLAIDIDEAVVNKVASKVKYAVTLDSTDIEALEGVGITKFDNVIIGIGNVEASIMSAVVLKELKIPNIIAKGTSSRHERVLQSIGVLKVVRPEVDAARVTALHSVYKLAMDVTDINDKYSMVQVICNNAEIRNKTIKELDTRSFGVNIVCIERGNKLHIPTPDMSLEVGDTVTFISENKQIKKMYGLLAGEVSIVDVFRWEKEHERRQENKVINARRKFGDKEDN